MAKETRKIISIDTGASQKSISDLRKEMSNLRDALLNCKEGTKEYDEITKKLQKDQDDLTRVMSATKKSVDALPGSYNALSKELSEVKKKWKETNDEAERNELGKRALELNNQLKELDSSIGNFQRNVGDYSNSIKEAFVGILNGSLSATAGIGAMKGALSGLLANPVVALAAAFTALVNAVRNNTVAMASIHEGMRGMEPTLSVFRNAIGEIGKIIGPIIKELGEVLQPLLPILSALLSNLLAPLKQMGTAIKYVLQFLKPITTLIGSVLNPVLETTIEVSDELIKLVIKGLNLISKPFKSFINMVISGVEGVLNVLSKLPGMQDKFKESIDALERIKVSIKDFKFDENDFTSSFSDISKGVNEVSNSYNALQQRLSDLKKLWAETNSEAERITLGKQIREVEKELEEMEKSLHGSEESVRLLEGSYAALREELTNLTTQWENTNNQAERDVLAVKIKEVNSQMVELAKQLQEAKEEEAKTKEETEHLAGSYAALRDKLSELKKQWEETNSEAERKGLATQIREVDSQIKLLDATTQSYNSMVLRGIETISKEIVALSNPLAVAKTATVALGNAMKALIANPVGAFIMAIVAAVKLLKMGFEGSESASNKLKMAFAALEPITNAIKNGLTGIANVVGDILQLIPKLVEGVQSAGVKIAEILNKMGLVSDEKLQQMKDNIEEGKTLVAISMDLAQREIDIQDRKRAFLVEEAKVEMEVSELRAKAAETDKYTAQERARFLEEAKNKEKALMDERLAIAQEEYDIAKTRAALTDNTDADYDRLAELEANLYKVKKDYNDKIRSLNKGIASNSKSTNQTVREEEDKTLEHLKATIQERMKLVLDGTLSYLDLKRQEEEVDWKIQEERLKKEKFTDEQIEVFRKAHLKRLTDIQKEMDNLYKEEIVEEDIDETPILDKVREINQLKLNLQNEYADEYYKILKDQENAEYLEAQVRLELEGATDEEIELYRQNHIKNLEDIDKQRLTKQIELNEELKEHTLEMRDSIVEALSSIGNAWESLLEAQLKTGKISEKEYERRKKALQSFQIAAIIAQQAASIFDVWSGYAKEVGTINAETASATGPLAAATKTSLDAKSLISAIAKTTALAATGASQIAAVKSSGSNALSANSTMISANAQPDTAGLYSGIYYSRNLQTIQEEENLNKETPLWVSVVDIERMRQRVIVRDAEATW